MGAQLTQLASLSVVAKQSVRGQSGRPVPALELLGGLSALSRLTRLTSLTVEGRSTAGKGGPKDHGAPARDVLRALPRGVPLKQVGKLLVGHELASVWWATVGWLPCNESD